MDYSQDQSAQNTRHVAGTRRYRSKSQRPCDLCRTRKVLCNIPDPTRPCQLCDRIGRECTFVGNPNKKPRDRRVRRGVDVEALQSPSAILAAQTGTSFEAQSYHGNGDLDETQTPVNETGSGITPIADMLSQPILSDETDINWDLTFNHQDQAFDFLTNGELPTLDYVNEQTPPELRNIAHSPNITITAQASTDQSIPVERLSMDQTADCSTSLIGFSNESDPFSLDHFPYGSNDEVDFFRVTYRRQEQQDHGLTIHFLQSQTATAVEGQRVIEKCISPLDDRKYLETLVDRETGVALVKLYFRFVFKSLPILSSSQVFPDLDAFVSTASTGLLAGIYALALPFTSWDEKLCLDSAYSKPDIKQLWQVSYTSLQKELHFPRLSTIQIYILLLNYTPFDAVCVENPFVWSLASSMLAMSQSLGLNVDPKGWKLPDWEIRLRRRLWWAVYVEYTWRAVTHGRCSMLSDDDWNVAPLTEEDFLFDATAHVPDYAQALSYDYFVQLCSLTEITSQICRQFFSLRAVSRPQVLEDLLEQARRPRQQLLEWLQSLPGSLVLTPKPTDIEADTDDSITSHRSLYVAYYTAHILILRALLRPIIDKNTSLDHHAQETVLQSCRGLIQTVIKFIRGLDARHQSAFWPAYTRNCLAYPGLFCYMLCLQKRQPEMSSYDQNLLATWRRTLRTRMQSWPFLRFAIVKVDAIYWKKLY
ncbi:fungal-specific transcription factor domain-containing protein [Fusarium venenatum]|uniref:fungal-specific transcription factor domain-containing protein n=1 Tax=Fusarium venenatum TaxID=56646 RepID=UPI001E0C2EBD|nr:fungal-specific transcription factor domain-containing protein [Fusarium venenatum]